MEEVKVPVRRYVSMRHGVHDDEWTVFDTHTQLYRLRGLNWQESIDWAKSLNAAPQS